MHTEAKVEVLIPRTTGFALLVVDDEVSIRNLCRDVATDAEFQVYVAATTEEALEILEQHPIDIVVTDLKVPQIGGLELLKRIRSNSQASG